MIANMWWKNDKPCSSRALLFIEILTPLGKVSQNTAPSFLENLNFVMCQFSPLCYPKGKENKMKPWKCHVLTTSLLTHMLWNWYGSWNTYCSSRPKFCMDIYKQHQDLIGSVLSFRTKIIWSGPEFGLVRCGYLNAAISQPVICEKLAKKRKQNFNEASHSSNMHAQPSSGAWCLNFGRTLRLLPYFMCANSNGSQDCADAQAHLNLRWSPVY